MVNLQDFYKTSLVRIDPYSASSADRINRLVGQVITRLPDEEQFGMTGSIFIGPKEAMVNLHKKSSVHPVLGRGLGENLFIKDGNYRFWFLEDLKDSSYLITLALDTWDEKSDNYIIGLIAYKMSELSYVWKVRKIPPIGSEEYERKVDEEAKRLGFAKELLAYDTQS